MIRTALIALATIATTGATLAPSSAEARTMTLRQHAMLYLTPSYAQPLELLAACTRVEMIGQIGPFAMLQGNNGVFFIERGAMTPHARAVCGRG